MATTITVEGMTSGHCEQTLEEMLQTASSMTDRTADRENKQASVEGEVDVMDLVQAVGDPGYTAHV